jgi:hypothetical protein
MDMKNKYLDIYKAWNMDDPASWQHDWVKEAFDDLYQLWTSFLVSWNTPSCKHVDDATVDILHKHQKGPSAAPYQAIFVALLLQVLDLKANDDFHLKQPWILTHGWKSRFLSHVMAQLLRENILHEVLALHQNPSEKKKILDFFSMS